MTTEPSRPVPAPDVAVDHEARNRRLAARLNVTEWLAIERREHGDVKYADGTATRDRLAALMESDPVEAWDEFWQFASNYLSRVNLYGLDTLRGRQALGKTIVVLLHTLETAVATHGPMPQPGLSSTEDVREWVRGG